MVDSNDRERISESREELWRLLAEDGLKDSVLLVMANKQDLPNAMSVEEVTEKMELDRITNKKWRKCLYLSVCYVVTISPPVLTAQLLHSIGNNRSVKHNSIIIGCGMQSKLCYIFSST